ncbi:MAG TPA: cation diffusion facilitator family transporter [Acidimicrobiales bacterium]
MTEVDEGSKHTSTRAVIVALLANIGVAAAKLVGFLLTGSSSLVAEFAHSLADTGNQVVLLVGKQRSEQRADLLHPFGYGAYRFLGGFLVAEILFGLGALFSIYEGIEKLIHPHPVDYLPVAFAILAVTIALESWSLRTAVGAANQQRENAGWLRFVRATRVPELAVLLLEDSGALLGLGFALVALILTAVTGSSVFDAAGSLAIGLLLGTNSLILGTEMVSLLVGESASDVQLKSVEDALAQTQGIERVVHLRAVHVSPEELLVGAKVIFDPALSVSEAAVVVDQAEVAIRSTVPSARWVYIEPGIPEPPPA